MAMLFAIVSPVVGITFALPANSAASNEIRVAWRLAAWVISAVAFAAHIYYEHVRLHSSSRTTAFHAALAVGLAGFGLAVSASLHGHATNHPFPVYALAIWPVMTALPAFVVALVAAVLLTRMRSNV